MSHTHTHTHKYPDVNIWHLDDIFTPDQHCHTPWRSSVYVMQWHTHTIFDVVKDLSMSHEHSYAQTQKMMATNRIAWHTHHIWRCQGTVYVTCTVLNHQQSKWRPCLPSVYGPYIMSHEHSYAQTQKMMATNRVAWHPNINVNKLI